MNIPARDQLCRKAVSVQTVVLLIALSTEVLKLYKALSESPVLNDSYYEIKKKQTKC